MTLPRLVRKALTYTALAIAGAAAVTGYTSANRAKQAEAAYPPLGAFVEVAGQRVHYVQTGSGPHVVLLHGAGGNLRDFTFDLAGRLADNYTVTAFDRPGMGYTDRVPGVATGVLATDGDSPAAQAEMLRDAANQLGVTAPVVVGHSYGGIVAMAWAQIGLDRDAPENASAVVSLAGVSMPWPGKLDRYYTVNATPFGGLVVIPLIAAFAPEGRVADAVRGVFPPDPVPEGYVEHIGAALAVRQASMRANVRQVNTLRPHVVAMTARYPELTLPIEILHGTADATVPIDVHPRALIKIIPSAHLTALDGVGHMPHHADPEAAVAAINRAATRAGLR